MNQPIQITTVLLRITGDLGHGGTASEYRIDREGNGYKVTRQLSRSFPAPGEGAFTPYATTKTIKKQKQQVEEFLRQLVEEFNVFALSDLQSPYPFLHPTFYTFHFGDAAGREHSFRYKIEGSGHLDARYQELVEAFRRFFEGG
jgi:hypothetical protein